MQYSFKATAVALVMLGAIPDLAFSQNCGFKYAFTVPDERGTESVRVYRSNPLGESNIRLLLFINYLKVNTDGTKISYHERDITGTKCNDNPKATNCAINNVRHAFVDYTLPVSRFEAIRDDGYPSPKTWKLLNTAIIEKDAKSGKPCITTEGYLVSMTADVAVPGGFNRVGDCDPAKWIDALKVPGAVLPRGPKKNGKRLPSKFQKLGATKRTPAIGLTPRSTDRRVFGIIGDIGPHNEIGEANIAFNRALNGLAQTEMPKSYSDAKKRFQVQKAAIILIPGLAFRAPRPLTSESVHDHTKKSIDGLGGIDRLRNCIRTEVDSSF